MAVIPTPKNASQECVDAILAREACNGSLGALRQLIERHQCFIYNVFLRWTGNGETARPLTEQVFYKMMVSMRYREPHTSFRIWLYRLAMAELSLEPGDASGEEALAAGRLYRLGPDYPALADPPFASVNRECRLKREFSIDCRTALVLGLDPDLRACFILSGVFDLKAVLGARILDLDVGEYRARLQRGKDRVVGFMKRRTRVFHAFCPSCCQESKSTIKSPVFADCVRDWKNAGISTAEQKHLQWFKRQPYERVDLAGSILRPLQFDTIIAKFLHFN